MSEKMIMVLFNVFVLLTLLVFQLLITKMSRNNILLGIKIPEEKMKTDEVKKLVKGYTRENIIVGIPTLILISLLIYYIDNIYIFTVSIFIYMGILFLIYLRWNKKTKDLKKEKQWDKFSSETIVIDTKFSRDKGKTNIISRKWFLIPLGLVLISGILSLVMYPSLPDQIPTHWDIKGNVDGYMNKSIMVAMLMPMVQLFMVIIMYFSNHFIIKSKQQIDHKNSEISLKKNIIFRKSWSIYLIVTLIILEIFFTLMNMVSLGILSNMRIINNLNLIATLFIVIGAIVLSVKLGQGGDRIKTGDEKGSLGEYDIDDDHLWKLGNTIYYNPDDASIFIEKRVGSGWTINAGRPAGVAIFIAPFIILILTFFFIK